MGFTDNQDLETQTTGQAAWDTGLEGNFSILDRGLHAKFSAAETINTGEVIAVTSGALAWKYNASSLDLRYPEAISYKLVNSGETATFLRAGIVNSIASWSGDITPGLPFFVSSDPGIIVQSYPAAAYAGGIALSDTSVLFNPVHDYHRERITETKSLGELVVGSTHFFTLDLGHAGTIQQIEFRGDSHDLWELSLYSGSLQVNSELLYQTQSGGITSFYISDKVPLPYRNTDTSSPALLFGTLEVLSGTSVDSAHVNLYFDAFRER